MLSGRGSSSPPSSLPPSCSFYTHDTSFHDSALLPPKACRLETGRKSPLARPVKGDSRCGYRALAAYLGISWSQVMQKLLGLMVASPGLFTVAEVLDFMSATDPNHACSRAAWLSNRHISLLCEVDAWFPQGIAAHRFQATPDFIHFERRGNVRAVSRSTVHTVNRPTGTVNRATGNRATGQPWGGVTGPCHGQARSRSGCPASATLQFDGKKHGFPVKIFP